MNEKQRIVILGGGYAGLMTAATLTKKVHEKRAEIILVNKNDYHYLTTKIHESAAGTVDSGVIKLPYSELIDTERVTVIQDEAMGIDLAKKSVALKNGVLNYDYLVVSVGGAPQTFGIPGLKENAYFLVDLEGTEELRNHIENQFRAYRLVQDEAKLTFVIGGAGFTGMEFLFELLERIPKLCLKYGIDEREVRVVCTEAHESLLQGYDLRMREDVIKTVPAIRCQFQTGLAVSSVEKDLVTFSDGSVLAANTLIWAGGIKGHPLLEGLGFELLDGRVKINEHLEVPGYKEIYVLGDTSVCFSPTGKPYPPSAQIALQQGQYCAKNIASKVYGQPVKPFEYIHRGTVMSMGRNKATGIVYGNHINGRMAAMMKHIVELRYFYMLGGVSMLLREWKRERKYKSR